MVNLIASTPPEFQIPEPSVKSLIKFDLFYLEPVNFLENTEDPLTIIFQFEVYLLKEQLDILLILIIVILILLVILFNTNLGNTVFICIRVTILGFYIVLFLFGGSEVFRPLLFIDEHDEVFLAGMGAQFLHVIILLLKTLEPDLLHVLLGYTGHKVFADISEVCH